MKIIDRIDQIFGRLTVIERAPNNSQNKAAWWCLCSCGTKKIVSAVNLARGSTLSCGCLQRELASERCSKLAIQRTHCRRGHLLSEDNVYRSPKYPNRRRCKICLKLSFPSVTKPILLGDTQWRSRLKNLYGITPQDYMDLLEKQDGRCAVCRTERCDTGRRFAVDHDHKTGKVRGLLCNWCNSLVLPVAEKDPALVMVALNYLQQHEAALTMLG